MTEIEILRAEIARLETENAALRAVQDRAKTASRESMRKLRARRKSAAEPGVNLTAKMLINRPESVNLTGAEVSQSQQLGYSEVRWDVKPDPVDGTYKILDLNSNREKDQKMYVPNSSERVTRTRTEYPPEFEICWKAYPRRLGGNPKLHAFRAWRARLQEGAAAEELAAGVTRYAEFCKASGSLGTAFVMQAKRFFGPAEEFREEWALPAASDWREGESIFDELWRYVNDSGGWRQVGADFVPSLESRVRAALSAAGGLKAIAESDQQGFQAKRRTFGKAYQEMRP